LLTIITWARRSLESGLRSFPDQRLVIKPNYYSMTEKVQRRLTNENKMKIVLPVLS